MVRCFIEKAGGKTKDEIERLIAGEEIIKEIHQELTYSELDRSIDNLWSVLFITGYLTQREAVGEERYRLAIPNREIRQLFIKQIREWFRDAAEKDTPRLDALCEAGLLSQILNLVQDTSISPLRETPMHLTGQSQQLFISPPREK